ncbi:MAG: hypothetical protein SFV20_10640 [Sphingopyxis sp.]|nr:hypothetical protein [Sphingopyxis sp.]
MTAIQLRAAFGHAKALAVKDWQALLLYLALGVLVPYLLHAGEPTLSLRALVAVVASGGYFGGSLAGPFYLAAIIAVLWTAAQFALWNALLPDLREGPVSEIMYALVAGVAYLVCYIVASFLIAVLPGLALGLALEPLRLSGSDGMMIAAGIQTLVNLGLGAFIGARLWLTGPIMAANGDMNPIPALMESWRRTAPSWGKLFLLYFFLQLVATLAFVGLFAAGSAIILADPQGEGWGETAMAVVWLLFWLVVFAVQALLAGGMYLASQRETDAQVFA